MSELFLKIINMSISASWLVLVVLAFRFLFRKAPKWVNVLLWGIVAVRLICPFSIESALSLIPSAETFPEKVISGPNFDVQTGIALVDHRINDYLGDHYFEGVTVPANNGNNIMTIFAFVWIIGVLLLLAYTIFSYQRLHQKIETAVRYKDNIFQSENVGSPFVLGIIKPRIYLPYNMDEQDLEHVVAHERAHIRRKDHLWKPLGFLLLTIHWFNPLMWLAYVLLCRDIELACDEKVIQELGNEQRADYSQALVACSVNRRTIAACPLAFGEVGVKERVKSVLNYKKPAFWVIVVSVVACVVVAVCFLTNPRGNSGEPDLSFLNYENAISIVADVDEVMAIYCPTLDEGSGSSIQIGVATGSYLAKYLDRWNWKECNAPRQPLPSPGSVEFIIEDDYRITVHQRKQGTLSQYAVVKYQDEVRYYKIDRNDYADAVALVHAPAKSTEGAVPGKTYLYEKEGIMGDFTITLYDDGTFSYYEGMASSYLGFGSWKQEGDIITMTDDGNGGYGLVNRFKLDGDDIIFVEDSSSNFIYVKVQDGEQFHCTDEAFKQTDTLVQLGGDETLSLDNVVMLSQKGYDLTWSDFDQYRYIETGSGLYIRVYEINEMYELWIGGSWIDEDLMYIYLTLADDLNTRIDIRDGGVEEFITKDHSETLLNKAIHDAIINCNWSEETLGLNHCASFVMLDKEEISGTPAVGSTDHVGVVTVYGLALYHGYDLVDDELYVVEGSHTPVAITFDVLNGKYSLKEYWRPGDGIYYAPDIREKFPDHIEDEVMDTQKYYAAQNQECYVQAMRNNGGKVSNPGWQPISAEELSWFNETFQPFVYDKRGEPIGVNPWSCFFTSYYDNVRNLNFVEFMRYFPGDGSFVSDEEFSALIKLETFPFYGVVSTREDMPVPVSKYPANLVNQVLTSYAGITTKDLDTSGLEYLQEYDSFYNYTSDFGPGMFTCTRGEVDGDIVRLYEELQTGTDMLTLRKVGSGYQIVTHQRLSGDNTAERVYGR